MIARNIASLLAAASFTTALAGCSSEERTGTRGQLGNLRFAYSVPGICASCTLDRELLVWSSVGIEVHDINPNVDYQVRSSDPTIASVHFAPRCRFVGQDDCHENVLVETNKAGDADLEMFDEWTGTVLDRVTVKVRNAATIETTVKASPSQGGPTKSVAPSPGGVFELMVDSDVEIVSIARAENGTELLAAGGALKSIYTNERIVGPRPVSAPAPTIEYAKAKKPGATTVAVTGSGVRTELAFRVVSSRRDGM